MTADSSGNIVGQQAHYPFGESWYSASTTTKWQFTSYERDAEPGNDFAVFRYNVNRFGRFSSPDLLAGSITNPQSLNRYAYVRNDPLSLVDPLGLQDEGPTNLGCNIGGADFSGSFCDLLFGLLFGRGPRGDFPREKRDRPDRENKLKSQPPAPKPQPPAAKPQSEAQRLAGFNQCVAQAASTERQSLTSSIAETTGGALGILFTIGTGAATFEVAGEELATKKFFDVLEGIDLGARAASIYTAKSLLFGYVYGKGISDITKALNRYDSDVAGCQAQYGYPNVP